MDTIAKLKPVLPDVVSIIVLPGERIPFFSASKIIFNAILSLLEWPGLKASSFVKKLPLKSLTIFLILLRGYFLWEIKHSDEPWFGL